MRANTVSCFKFGFCPCVSIGVQTFNRARRRRDQRRLKVPRRPFRQERGAPRGPGGVGACENLLRWAERSEQRSIVGGEAAFDDKIAGADAETRQHQVAHERNIKRRKRRPPADPVSPRISPWREANGPPPPCPAKHGSAMAPDAITRASEAGSGLPGAPAIAAYSRPPMKRAVATGRPSTSTLASVSSAGSSPLTLKPGAIRITQVPVETIVNGACREPRCGSSEALESWTPQNTPTSRPSPAAAAMSGLIGARRW